MRLQLSSFNSLLYLAVGGDQWEALARQGTPSQRAMENVRDAGRQLRAEESRGGEGAGPGPGSAATAAAAGAGSTKAPNAAGAPPSPAPPAKKKRGRPPSEKTLAKRAAAEAAAAAAGREGSSAAGLGLPRAVASSSSSSSSSSSAGGAGGEEAPEESARLKHVAAATQVRRCTGVWRKGALLGGHKKEGNPTPVLPVCILCMRACTCGEVDWLSNLRV